jgi:hypothetical protein
MSKTDIPEDIAALASESDAVQFCSPFLKHKYTRYGVITHAQGASSRPTCPC